MVTHPGSDHVRLCLTWLLRASARTLHCPLPIHLTQAGSYLPDKTLACSSDNLLRQIIMTRADLIVTVGICLVVLTCLMGTWVVLTGLMSLWVLTDDAFGDPLLLYSWLVWGPFCFCLIFFGLRRWKHTRKVADFFFACGQSLHIYCKKATVC